MFEKAGTDERNESTVAQKEDFVHIDGVQAIRRYMQIQREIAQLENEKEQLRNMLAKELEGKVPTRWHSTIDGKPILVVHELKTDVRYDEKLLRERLGAKYTEILEIDGAKIRKNRELVRPLLASVLDTIGTPAPSRVKAAVRSGLLAVEDFKGAFKKSVTPYISIRADNVRPSPSATEDPF